MRVPKIPDGLVARGKQAGEAARSRWPGMGGFCAYDPTAGSPWSVGYLRDTPHGPERVHMGQGQTPEEALESADRRMARLRDAESHPKPARKLPREGVPYPIAGDLFDEEHA